MARGLGALIATLAALLGTTPAAQAQELPPREFYGVVSQGDLQAPDFERMGAGRIGTVRLTLPWSEVDPSPLPRDYEWERFDVLVEGAARHGVSVLPTFYSIPRWVSTVERCEGPVNGPCAITPPRSEVGLRAWGEFVSASVERYGPGGSFWELHPEIPALPIRVWQVWNEPNSPGFYQPRPDVAGYARLLGAAAESIRAEDPSAEILLAGMFRYPLRGEKGGMRATDFLAQLYERPGAAADFDGVAVHPYAARLSGVKKALNRLLRVMRTAGDTGAGLWITEIGWASGGRPNPLNRGPEGQAARLAQSFRWLSANRAALGLRLIAWYAWRDTPVAETRCAWCAKSGLFRAAELRAKPAWEQLMQFTGGL